MSDTKIHLGKISFERDPKGLFVISNWNPQKMSRYDRRKVADQLRLIAKRMDRGYFAVYDKWKRFKSPRRVK